MFRKPDGTIQGIWFHNGPKREQMAILLQKVVKLLAVFPDAAAAALLSPLAIGDSSHGKQQPLTPPVHQPSPRTTPQQQQRTSAGGSSVNSAAAVESPVLDKKSL